MSKEASDIFQDHRRVPVSIVMVKLPLQSIWRGLLERFSKLDGNFIEASKKFKIMYRYPQHCGNSKKLKGFDNRQRTN